MVADDQLLNDLVEVGRDLWTSGLVTSHGGNLSARRSGGGALITATGAMLGRLSPQTLVEVDERGEARGTHPPAPSSDTAIHLAVYEQAPDAQAVVHSHPVHAITLTLDRDAIKPLNLEGRLFLGSVPVLDVEWETSAAPVSAALRNHPIVLTRAHGAYARGADAWDALRLTSALEEAAQIIWLREGRAEWTL